MTKELQVRAKLRGITPLMTHPMSDETLRGLETGQHPPIRKDRPRMAVAEERVYRGPNGELGFPSENLFSCIVGAGKLIKYDGKRSISTSDSSYVPEFLTIEEEFLPFTDLLTGDDLLATMSEKKAEELREKNMINPDEGWIVDVRRGQLENGTAVSIVRPKFPSWGLEVTFLLNFEETPMTEEKVRQLVSKAGRSQGLGSFRPNKKGPFGQFRVDTWQVLNGNGKH